MTTITPLNNPHGVSSAQGMMSGQHHQQGLGALMTHNLPPLTGLSHSTSSSFPPAGACHGSIARNTMNWGARTSATGTLPSTSTSTASLDARLSTGGQQHTPSPPTLPPGFLITQKESRQLLVMFSMSSIAEISQVEQFVISVMRQYEGFEKCHLVHGPTHHMVVCCSAKLASGLWNGYMLMS
jgi:hypothetical protein